MARSASPSALPNGGPPDDGRPDSQTDAPRQGWHYEAAVAEVEQLIAQMESGQLSLEETFGQFEQAVAQLKRCEAYLHAKQEQADLLIETLTEG